MNRRSALEFAAAIAALVGCVISWLAARSTVVVAPVLDGEPSTTSVAHYPPLVLLALVLATVAGVLAVVATARVRRPSDSAGSSPPLLHTP